jgi:hypothetical protein
LKPFEEAFRRTMIAGFEHVARSDPLRVPGIAGYLRIFLRMLAPPGQGVVEDEARYLRATAAFADWLPSDISLDRNTPTFARRDACDDLRAWLARCRSAGIPVKHESSLSRQMSCDGK